MVAFLFLFSLEKLKEAIEATEAEQKTKLAKCLNALKVDLAR